MSDSKRNPAADPDYMSAKYDSKGHQMRARSILAYSGESLGMRIYFGLCAVVIYGGVVYMLLILGWPS